MIRRALSACALCVFMVPGVHGAPSHCDVSSVRDGSGSATGRRFMVAAAHPDAVSAGCRVLAAGGSAADAAVAVQLVLAVVEPQASGPGGGTLALYYDARSGSMRVYDGLATVPGASGRDLREPLNPQEAAHCAVKRFPREVAVSLRAVAVPGTARTLEQIHRDHGVLRWRDLFEEAIGAARDGFLLPPYLSQVLSEPVYGRHRCAWPGVARRFCRDSMTPRWAGVRLTNPDAARTLERMRDEGSDAYQDLLADHLVRAETVTCHGDAPHFELSSAITRADLHAYRVIEREPLCMQVFEHRVCTAPPPSFGGFVVLRILDFMHRAGAGEHPPDSLATVHRRLQASHLAQMARRSLIGDPAFQAVDVAAALAPRALAREFARFSPRAVVPFTPPAAAGAGTDQTTHVSIVDARGNAIAMTATNNRSFGAHAEAAGFMLNNALGNFTSPGAQAGGRRVNAMGPGRRPRTAMAPTMVFDISGQLRLVAGSAGGAAIPDHVAQALLAVLTRGSNAVDALSPGHVSGQRVSVRGTPALRAELEAGTTVAAHRDALRALGYGNVTVGRLRSGLAIVRIRDDGVLEGGADPRRDGVAGGR